MRVVIACHSNSLCRHSVTLSAGPACVNGGGGEIEPLEEEADDADDAESAAMLAGHIIVAGGDEGDEGEDEVGAVLDIGNAPDDDDWSEADSGEDGEGEVGGGDGDGESAGEGDGDGDEDGEGAGVEDEVPGAMPDDGRLKVYERGGSRFVPISRTHHTERDHARQQSLPCCCSTDSKESQQFTFLRFRCLEYCCNFPQFELSQAVHLCSAKSIRRNMVGIEEHSKEL
jgi:hypothetical protein